MGVFDENEALSDLTGEEDLEGEREGGREGGVSENGLQKDELSLSSLPAYPSTKHRQESQAIAVFHHLP
jgi:hypothetical protein